MNSKIDKYTYNSILLKIKLKHSVYGFTISSLHFVLFRLHFVVMGINGINPLIKRKSTIDVFNEIHLSNFAGWRVAIDVSIFLYKFVKSTGEDGWLNFMVLLLCKLKKYRIKAICIFDGPNPPKEKDSEHVKRKAMAEDQLKKLDRVRELKTLIEVEYEAQHKRIPGHLRDTLRQVSGRARRIKEENDGVDYTSVSQVLEILEKRENTLTNQTTKVEAKYTEMVKEFLDIMGISYITADGEAETLAAWLCNLQKVDAVLSEDTDVMVYGTPIFLSKFDTKKDTVVLVDYNDVLKGLSMDAGMFRDLCIFCRCDYNKHENKVMMPSKTGKLVGVGPGRAYDLIKDYGSFEAIEAKRGDIDLSPLKWKRCREIFMTKPVDLYKHTISYSKAPKPEELILFLRKHDLYVDQTYIEDLWKPVGMVFVSNDKK